MLKGSPSTIRRVSMGETLFNPALKVRLIRELNPTSQRPDLNPKKLSRVASRRFYS